MQTVSISRTPSSREMMAAGTRPPRVMQTIARHSPLTPASRQASARASRWNWSHETGKAFSGSDDISHSRSARQARRNAGALDGNRPLAQACMGRIQRSSGSRSGVGLTRVCRPMAN